MRASRKALPVVLLAAALLAGCSSGGDDSASEAGDSGGALAPADAGGDDSSGGGSEAGQVTDLRVAPTEAVIRTADLEVRVDDVRVAADAAARLARAAGGSVAAEDRAGSAGGGSASVQLRVPPTAFDKAVADLSALGEERQRRLGSEDVTDQVVDLEARLATQRASVDRVRTLLGEANALGEVVQIESELTKRIADLESLEARLESLTARVELSTIVVRFTSEGGPVVGEALGFGDGLEAGWSTLAGTARVLAVTLGALLPFLPLLLVVGFLLWRARSRRVAVPPV